MTWEEYGERLEERLAGLRGRIHRGAYRAKPSRRVWVPKADGRQRPLGTAALEDRVRRASDCRSADRSPDPEEAERFLEQLREQLRKFGLELHPDKFYGVPDDFGGARISPVPRLARPRAAPQGLPEGRAPTLAANASAAQPAEPLDLGAVPGASRKPPARGRNPTPLPR
jgi:hypothetical protein